jgi:3D-(3,5/4)-trihydroxycyclohexane-1,2-dione acylhydrolase (decyclizing)
MNTVKLTAAEAVVRFLDNQFIEYDGELIKFVEGFFTLFGHGCVLGLGHALAQKNHALKVFQGKNEQGMAHAAMSFAKQHNRKKIIACTSSIGPGAANMITAAATATVNNIPLLLFPGDTFASRQPDPVLQQLEQPHDLTLTTNDAYRPVVRYFDRITRPETVMSALINAMRALTDTAHAGAVCIAFPQDVQSEAYDYPEEFFAPRVHKTGRPQAVKEEIEEAASLIRSAKKPLIICGGGARYSEAGKALMDLSEQCNIPIAETQAGKSTLPASFPLNLGGIGVTGNLAANTVAKDADVIIGVGTRFSDFTTASKFLYAQAKVISVSAAAYHGYKLDALKVTGDARAVLLQLTESLKGYKSGYTGEIAAAKAEWEREYERLASLTCNDPPEVSERTEDCLEKFSLATQSKLCQTTALACVRKHIPADAIAVGASGSLPGCMQRMWTTDVPYTYNMEYGFSCMGYEIAGALGSKLADGAKEVYAFAGDGSFLMLHSEMVTARQLGIKINILLFDNGGFGCINNLQMSQGIESLATEFRDVNNDFMYIDYAAVARGYGYTAYTVRDIEGLQAALEAARKEDNGVLIDIKVLPKTMTRGYESWWNVGCCELPKTEEQEKALQDRKNHLIKARRY